MKPPVFKEFPLKPEVNKPSFTRPPVSQNTQGALGSTGKTGGINYNEFNSKNAWLDRYSGDMKDILGLEESGTFEQVEKMVTAECGVSDPKGIFDVRGDGIYQRNTYNDVLTDGAKDSLDLTGLETLKRIGAGPEGPQMKNADQFNGENNRKIEAVKNIKAKPQVFDCDVSEIPQNR